MVSDVVSERWQVRLADELADDGIELPGDDTFRRLLLQELDYCRRAPIFEGRQATYGALIIPRALRDDAPKYLSARFACDVIPLDGDPTPVRAYADGRSTYLVCGVEGEIALACFERAMLFEADLIDLQQLTGSAIVQRTPVLDVVRVVVDGRVISWDGRNWQGRPTASSILADLEQLPATLDDRLPSVLDFAIHWLAPSRVGATIVLKNGRLDISSLDISTAAHTPPLSVTNRRHFAALAAVLRQHDLAVLVDTDGEIRKVAVGLRWSDEAEAAVDNDRGMRHRSAQRFSYDQPDLIVVVVSEDGPVTVFRAGEVMVTTDPASRSATP